MHAARNLHMFAVPVQPGNPHAADQVGKLRDFSRERRRGLKIDIVELVLLLHIAGLVVDAQPERDSQLRSDARRVLRIEAEILVVRFRFRRESAGHSRRPQEQIGDSAAGIRYGGVCIGTTREISGGVDCQLLRIIGWPGIISEIIADLERLLPLEPGRSPAYCHTEDSLSSNGKLLPSPLARVIESCGVNSAVSPGATFAGNPNAPGVTCTGSARFDSLCAQEK